LLRAGIPVVDLSFPEFQKAWNWTRMLRVCLLNGVKAKLMAKFLLWCILLVICWPLALLALIAYPFVWLLLLPFRIIGIAVGGVLELVSAIIFLPVRMVRAI